MLEKLDDIRRRYEEIRGRLGDPEFVQDHKAVRDAQRTLSEFEPIVGKIEERARIARELQGARELTDSLPPSAANAEELLDQLVHADAEDLRDAPEAILRALFDAFRLRVTYDNRTGEATCRVVLSDDTLLGVDGALQAALMVGRGPGTDDGDRTAAGGGTDRLPHAGRDPRFPSAWRPRQDSNLRHAV